MTEGSTRMQMITVGDVEQHENPNIRECTRLLIEFGMEIDKLTDRLVNEAGTTKLAANAMVGALSAVLGRHAATFACAACLNEEQTADFIRMTADSVVANAEQRLPCLRQQMADYHKNEGGKIH